MKILLVEFGPFNAIVMLKTTFSKHRLIKINMTYMYMKLEVKKNDSTAMSTAINQACIG